MAMIEPGDYLTFLSFKNVNSSNKFAINAKGDNKKLMYSFALVKFTF